MFAVNDVATVAVVVAVAPVGAGVGNSDGSDGMLVGLITSTSYVLTTQLDVFSDSPRFSPLLVVYAVVNKGCRSFSG